MEMFHYIETKDYLCNTKKLYMEAKSRFNVTLSNEAQEFLDGLPNKVREKIIGNIRKSTFVLDPDLFKKLDDTDIWEFRTFYNKTKKFYTLEEIEDKYIGEKGTPKRNAYEEELNSFLIGEAIKQARQSKNLTQEELGNLIGVQRAQISRIEKGKNLTFSTIARVFKAMGISAKLEIGSMGKVALW